MTATAINTAFEEEIIKATLTMLVTEKLITSAEFKAILEEQKNLKEKS